MGFWKSFLNLFARDTASVFSAVLLEQLTSSVTQEINESDELTPEEKELVLRGVDLLKLRVKNMLVDRFEDK